mmetsp:Transcript_77851/g.147926  ORF Transcript_77851/g.147926 Transcript_77851/m.147926 type:complete len:675 (+) Transcript_77851:116-2140(+)
MLSPITLKIPQGADPASANTGSDKDVGSDDEAESPVTAGIPEDVGSEDDAESGGNSGRAELVSAEAELESPVSENPLPADADPDLDSSRLPPFSFERANLLPADAGPLLTLQSSEAAQGRRAAKNLQASKSPGPSKGLKPGKKKAQKKKKLPLANKDEDDDSLCCEWMLRMKELGRSSKVKEFQLEWTHIGTAGAERLAAAICLSKKKKSLALLQLRGNYIGTFGVKPLAAAIEKYCPLQKLLLAWNSIDDGGAARLAATVKASDTLIELNLAHNHITSHGAKKIAEALEKNSSLCKLDLQCNLIGPAGILDLRSSCPNKLTLSLQGNWSKPNSGGEDSVYLNDLREMQRQNQKQFEALEDDVEPVKAAPELENLEDLSVAEMKARVKDIFERKNPAKVEQLDALFTKYAGSELVVYKQVCNKYDEPLVPPILTTNDAVPREPEANLLEPAQLHPNDQHLGLCWSGPVGYPIPWQGRPRPASAASATAATEADAPETPTTAREGAAVMSAVAASPAGSRVGSPAGSPMHRKIAAASPAGTPTLSPMHRNLAAASPAGSRAGTPAGSPMHRNRAGGPLSLLRRENEMEEKALSRSTSASGLSQRPAGAPDLKLDRPSRNTGIKKQRDMIVIDLSQKPAGDRWRPGLALERALLQAEMLGNGGKRPATAQKRRQAW